MDVDLLKAMCSSVPGRYAFAVFSVAEKLGIIERTLKEVSIAARLLEKGQPFRIVILRALHGGTPPSWWDAFCKTVNFHEIVMNFLAVVVHNRRVSCLHDIVRLLGMLVDHALNQESLSVYTAHEINDEQKEQVFHKLYRLFGKKLFVSFDTDESLYGGILVQSNTITIDASVKHQIEKFARGARSYFDGE
ncbi:MAG: ATP synthase F1 subunit delta [Holosporales bacterium]|nr:ATP synthase F1 subunit delta [Holosporales bacterium]